MERGRNSWNDVRGKGFFAAVFIAFCGAYLGHAFYLGLTAKAPGETHCYGNVCHRVHSLEETRQLIGQTTEVIATHYDAPGVDKYNVGQYTSSGEEFDAENAARAAAVHYPDGTELLIWHPGTRRAAHIRVNDFGPFMGKRTLDVTRKVAETMGWAKNGVATLNATVIWVPPPSDPKYKKGRVYPASLGLIGVVESYQYQALAERLIATGPARNGQSPGPAMPNVPEVLASVVLPAPKFRSEGVTEADVRRAQEAVALAQLMAQVPKAVTLTPPEIVPVIVVAEVLPPAFRAEAITDTGLIEAGERIAVARAFAALPQPVSAAELPAELIAPTVVAAAAPIEQVNASPANTAPVKDVQSSTGSQTANQSTLQPNAGLSTPPASRVAVETSAQPAGIEPGVARSAAAAETPADAVVTVATAQTPISVSAWSFGQFGLWIGIGLMLSSLWGVRSLNRSRRNGAAAAVAIAPEEIFATTARHDPQLDPLAAARLAAEKAEVRARAALAAEQELAAANEEELNAREDLARELALREFEREQEANTRARAEAAAAAHELAQRELAALEASRATRRAELERQQATLAGTAMRPTERVLASAPVTARVPKPVAQPVAPRALANDAEMAGFPGIADRALVGAILDLPGATKYWGNTIIAQMRLDGSARSGTPLRIDGVVDGACTAPVLLVSEGAVVTGVVAADTIVVLGKVSGILAGRNVYVASSAVVEGEIYYQTMSIDPHAHCDVSFSRLPQESDPIELGSTVYAARAA